MNKRSVGAFLAVASFAATEPSDAKEKITFLAKDATRYAARKADCAIEVFSDTKPAQPYTDIGIINYHDERHRMKDGALKVERVIPKLKPLACKSGGDAIIDVKVTEVRRLEFAMFNVQATLVRFETK